MNTPNPLPPILVADDNATDVFFLQRRLTAAGIVNPLDHVEDGFEAVSWIEKHAFLPAGDPQRAWLLFLDLKMPRKNGFEVLEWLVERSLLQTVTVSVLSTSDEPKDVQRAMDLGAHHFLVKYPGAGELNQFVNLAARRSRGEECSDSDLRGAGLSRRLAPQQF